MMLPKQATWNESLAPIGHVGINRCNFVMRRLANGEAWTMLLLHLYQKDSSSKHYASSMQIAPSESPEPSRRMRGRGR